jgi:3-methyladenine DNA glycosylase Tag
LWTLRQRTGAYLRLVSSWPDSQVDRLLAYPGMIRNRKKVIAVLRNGREFLKKLKDMAQYELISTRTA